MKTPITYYGGKQTMLKHILPLIPRHTLYTEAFCGGCAVLFAKEPVKINVINDLNGELINFYRTIVTDYDALKIEVESTLHAREQHQVAWFIYNNPTYFDRVKRAWAVWTLSNLGFSGLLSCSFGFSRGASRKTIKIANSKESFDHALRKLLECCTIERDDAFAIIKRYDMPDTFHFVDPPYVGNDMGHYGGMFSMDDLQRLLELLSQIRGKFMLTMYPNDLVLQNANTNGWIIHKIQRCVTAAKLKRRRQEEWIVCNYTEPEGIDQAEMKGRTLDE